MGQGKRQERYKGNRKRWMDVGKTLLTLYYCKFIAANSFKKKKKCTRLKNKKEEKNQYIGIN